MSREPMIVQGMSEAVAAVPYLFGTNPSESLVVFSLDPNKAPMARVDLPSTDATRAAVAEAIAGPYHRNGTGQPVVLMAFTADREQAAAACAAVTAELEPLVPVRAMVMVDGDRWQRLDALDAGEVSQSTRDRFAAEVIFRRGASPATSMADLEARFAPAQPLPPELVADAVQVARERSGEGADAAERAWMRMVLERHLASNEPLSDQHAARLVADVQSVGLRDYAAAVITRGHAREHGELWRDVTTRTPAELRAPVASLAAYSYFMGGDGLSTRLALAAGSSGLPAGPPHRHPRPLRRQPEHDAPARRAARDSGTAEPARRQPQRPVPVPGCTGPAGHPAHAEPWAAQPRGGPVNCAPARERVGPRGAARARADTFARGRRRWPGVNTSPCSRPQHEQG